MSMKQTKLAIRTHSFSARKLADYPSLCLALFEVKEACALANQQVGDLSAAKAKQIIKICQESRDKLEKLNLKVDPFFGGGGIGINQNVNEYIVDKAKDGLTVQEVNRSQSTADVVHTALRLALLRAGTIFHASLTEMAEQAADKANAFQNIATLSRTCLRDAMPTTLDKLFSGYAAALKRVAADLSFVLCRLEQVNLGGTVIGSGEGASVAYRQVVLQHLNSVTKLKLTHRESLYDAAQNSDDINLLGSVLETITSVLMKIARDIRLLASGPNSGFAELNLPKVIKGSSFFNDKVNPTIPETLMQAVWRTQGFVYSARSAINHAELDLNVFEPFAGMSLLEGLVSLNFAVKSFSEYCLKNITANEEVCAEHVRRYKETTGAK